MSSLLEKGADPNHRLYWSDERGWRGPPLCNACKDGKLQIVRLLVVRGGADVNRGGVVGFHNWSPLHWACRKGYKDLVQYLIEEAKCVVGEYQLTI